MAHTWRQVLPPPAIRITAKAAQSTVNSLTQTVNTKASQAAPNGLTQTVAGHTTALAGKGNCRIYYASYTGDGQDSKMLTFPGEPLQVTVMGGNLILHAVRGISYTICHNHTGLSSSRCAAVWNGSSFTWTGQNYNLNSEGILYQVIALMAADE